MGAVGRWGVVFLGYMFCLVSHSFLKVPIKIQCIQENMNMYI